MLIATRCLSRAGRRGTSSVGWRRSGLTMFGQMTAGSWIYIGTQGILQGTYETFAAAGDSTSAPDLTGRNDSDGGPRRMGGAQPLAAKLAGAAILCVEVDRSRIRAARDPLPRRVDGVARRALGARPPGRAKAAAVGRAARQRGRSCSRAGEAGALRPVTDQTAAHDPLNGYVPAGVASTSRGAARATPPGISRSPRSIAAHVEALVALQDARAATCSTTATTCAARHSRRASRARSSTRASSRLTSGRSSARDRTIPLGRALG